MAAPRIYWWPHIGGVTEEARAKAFTWVLEKVAAFLDAAAAARTAATWCIEPLDGNATGAADQATACARARPGGHQ
jgi:hypothetical protein